MSQRGLTLNYSEKLDTSGDGCLPETQEISQLFLNYLKTQSITDSDSLKRSKEFLKKLQTALIIITWYEAIAFFGCFFVIIIIREYQLIYIGVGIFLKILMSLYLTNSAKKEKKYIGMKSTITRKIFINMIKQDITIDPENRVEIRLVDLKIASKLNFKQILKGFVKKHIISLIINTLLTIGIYIIYIQFILLESRANLYLIFSEFALITLPLTIILLSLVFMILFVCINSFINFIHIIIGVIINICVSLPGVLGYLLRILKIKKENHNILMKYNHKSFTQKDICSICLCTFQNQGILLPCKHLFHTQCIEKWFFANNSCPICRAKINNKDENNQN